MGSNVKSDKMNLEDMLSTFCDDINIPQNDVDYTVPETIQNYRKIIQANNAVSIFDADYYTLNDSDDQLENGCSSSDNSFPKDEQLTYVVSGRGRGGRNRFYKPGESISTPTDNDDIIRQIRKLHGPGYGNEITELSVKAHQKSMKSNQGSTTSNSPVTLSNSANSNTPDMFADVELSDTSKENMMETVEPPKQAPPLSVLLRQAREEVKDRKAKKTLKELNCSGPVQKNIELPVSRTLNPPNRFLYVVDNKPVNISSEEEFPTLEQSVRK